MMDQADAGVIGMGEAFTLRLARAGVRVACGAPEALAARLRAPRRLLIRVPDIAPVLNLLDPHLGEDDLIVDLSAGHFLDTERRARTLGARGIHYLGTGMGPGLMVGGNPIAFHAVKPLLDAAFDRFAFVGPRGAGHFAGMVRDDLERAAARQPDDLLSACTQSLERLHAAFDEHGYLFDLRSVVELWKGTPHLPDEVFDRCLSDFIESHGEGTA